MENREEVKDDMTLLEKIAKVERVYRGTKFDSKVDQLLEFYHKGSYKAVEATLAEFPDEVKLLEVLVEKLKDKSVYQTLKKIIENKPISHIQKLKGMFSLGTHVAIEIEQGNKEYKLLLPLIYEKIGNLVYMLREA